MKGRGHVFSMALMVAATATPSSYSGEVAVHRRNEVHGLAARAFTQKAPDRIDPYLAIEARRKNRNRRRGKGGRR